MQRRHLLAWSALALAVLALRLPWILLPGLGRDEATYLVWSHHPEPAYAPLLQLLVALSRGVGDVVGPRLPSVLSGVAVLWLFERWLAARAVAMRDRWIAVALVAVSPWQTYAGSILHPDDLQLAAALAFVLAAHHRSFGAAALAAGLATWAKPSGLLVTVVALAWALRAPGLSSRRRALLVGAIGAIALPPLFAVDPGLVRGVLAFGSDGTGPAGRVLVFLIATLVLAGPALPVVGGRGAIEALRARRDPGAVLGLAFVLAFGIAGLIGGQVKGNWMLPAVLLLWPTGLRWSARTASLALIPTALMTVVITVGFVRPDLARELEEGGGAPAYLDFAGEREAEVASATAWWHRLAEYRWFEAACPDDVEVVVSDDYGFAAQWAVRCPNGVPRLVLPLDPLFADAGATIPRGALVLAVRHDVEALVGERAWTPLAPFSHPITGAPVVRARVSDDPPPR